MVSRLLSIIVPVYNEQDAVRPFLERLIPALHKATDLLGTDGDFEIVFVDDGSSDLTLPTIVGLRASEPRINAVVFSRNFGKEAAVSAGLKHARGDAVVIIDVDLQDPPELIVAMVQHWLLGYKMVTGVRGDRTSDTFLKRHTATAFYAAYNRMSDRAISRGAGDYRLLDRKVVDALNELPDRTRFMKGLFSWVGFKSIELPYTRERRMNGTTKFNYWRLWNFALDGITASTTTPLRIWTYLGLMLSLGAFLYAAFIIGRTILFGPDTPGYASLITVVLLMGGINLLSLGIIGEYVGRILGEVRHRPLYIVDTTLGLSAAANANAPEEAWTPQSISAWPDKRTITGGSKVAVRSSRN